MTLEPAPYAVLGVMYDSSDEQVTLAFRRIAQAVHPDRNPAPDAAERFHEAREAFELVTKMRAAGVQYTPDQSEVDAMAIPLGRSVRSRQGWVVSSR